VSSPTGLTELAEKVIAGVQQGAQMDRAAEQVAQLKRLHSAVIQLHQAVTGTTQLVRAAVGAGVEVPVDGLARLVAPLKAAAASAVRGEADGAAIDALAIAVRNQLSSVQSAITVSWRELVDRYVPQREGLMRLAETFRQLDASSTLASELRQAVEGANELARTAPSVQALARLERISTRIPELLRDLVGDDPIVRDFAERVARGGAPLSSITPEVTRWLGTRGFERSFKVVPGEPKD
jgi:hypothetical protein